MAHEARRAAMKAMRSRTLSITVNPPPIGFAERRSILQVLEQHGAVEFFRQAPNNDTVFVSVMKEAADVSRLIGLSPLKYGVSVPESTMETYLSDLSAPEKFRKSSITQLPKKLESPANEESELKAKNKEAEGPLEKDFTIFVWPNTEYRHEHANVNSPLYTSWPDFFDDESSFITQTLKQSMPDTLATRGLAHWNLDLGKMQQSHEVGKGKSKQQERLQTARWLPSKMKNGSARKSGGQRVRLVKPLVEKSPGA